MSTIIFVATDSFFMRFAVWNSTFLFALFAVWRDIVGENFTCASYGLLFVLEPEWKKFKE